MKITQYVFKKSRYHWLCSHPLSKNWFICRQVEPLIIVEYDRDLQTGKIVGLGTEIIGKVENCKEYNRELKRAIAFTKAYIKRMQNG